MGKPEEICMMHDLMYLLTQKIHMVFFNAVIHTIIDQNWDIKGFKQVLSRILKIIDIRPPVVRSGIEKILDKLNRKAGFFKTRNSEFRIRPCKTHHDRNANRRL